MLCKFENLPKQCQQCVYLHCGYVRMNGENEYHCSKIPCFFKYKKDDCENFLTEDMIKKININSQ